MARTLPVFVLFAALGACGQGSGTPATSDRPEAMGDLPRVSVGNSIQVPTDLVAEAVYLRSIGGVVVRASLRDRSATSTQISSSPPYFLAMDFVNGTFEVTDALGEAVGATGVVRGRIGPLRVVDVSGNPISVVVSDDGSLIRDQLYMPESGEFVLFLGPLRSDGTRLLNWREAISNGIVSGANTVLLRDVSIEALRRSGAPDAG